MVHHQVGIAFSTPYIIGQKMAKLYLHRTSNDAKSNMIDFYFLKKENGGTKRAKESTGSSIIFSKYTLEHLDNFFIFFPCLF